MAVTADTDTDVRILIAVDGMNIIYMRDKGTYFSFMVFIEKLIFVAYVMLGLLQLSLRTVRRRSCFFATMNFKRAFIIVRKC